MAQIERAYTREYSYVGPSSYANDFIRDIPRREDFQKGTVPRRREEAPVGIPMKKVKVRREDLSSKPKLDEVVSDHQDGMEKGVFRTISFLVIIGVLLLAIVWMNARATSIQYSINQMGKENVTIANEIAMLNIEIEGANSIESVEEYAIGKLKMKYPSANQCIYLSSERENTGNLARTIKKKAYSS